MLKDDLLEMNVQNETFIEQNGVKDFVLENHEILNQIKLPNTDHATLLKENEHELKEI